MLTSAYWVIVVFFLGLAVASVFRERRMGMQINAVLVVIVLLLRALGLK